MVSANDRYIFFVSTKPNGSAEVSAALNSVNWIYHRKVLQIFFQNYSVMIITFRTYIFIFFYAPMMEQ